MKNESALLILALVVFSILPNFASADLGPKPTVDIYVNYNGNKIPDATFSAKMLACVKENRDYPGKNLIPQLDIGWYDPTKDCYWTPEYLAWGGNCRDSKCDFYYMPPLEFTLAVYVPSLDEVFITNEISRTKFNSYYNVTLNSDGSAEISETAPWVTKDDFSSFIKALIVTLIIELLVALIYLSITRLPKKILIGVFIGSLITLPVVWFVFPLIATIPFVFLLSEIFAIVFEAYFIYHLNKQAITLKKSFLLSAIMNLASLIIGGFIFLFL